MTGGTMNHWVAWKWSLASWEGNVPPGITATKLFELHRAVLAAGEEERVWQVLETESPLAYRAAPGYSYADYLEDLYRRDGKLRALPLCTFAHRTQQGIVRTPARVAYFGIGGEIEEADVENLGLLLRRLRPECPPEVAHAYTYSVAPVGVAGSLPPYQGGYGFLTYGIELLTDIWFPRVRGWMEEEGEEWWTPPESDGLYDNSALAARHTPRLNRFLMKVRELVLANGGSWSLGQAENRCYQKMYDELGIHLP